MPTKKGELHPLAVALGNWLSWGDPKTHNYFIKADQKTRGWLVKAADILNAMCEFLKAGPEQKELEFKKLYDLTTSLYNTIPASVEIEETDEVTHQLLTLIVSVFDDVTALDGVRDRLGTLWLHTASELFEKDLDAETVFAVRKTSEKLAGLVKSIELSEVKAS